MEIEVTTTVWIEIDQIIEENNLNMNSTDEEINNAIEHYVCGLDDCYYYILDENAHQQIFNEIRSRIGAQLTFL